MKTLLYLGNIVSKHGKTATNIETLSELLSSERFNLITASSHKNVLFRLLEMLYSIYKNKKNIDYILIDTYSTLNFWYAFLCSQVARFFRIKYIPILHGGNLPNRLIKNPKICIQVFKNAYCSVAPSGYLLKAFNDKGYNNVFYIPNVLEINHYPFLNREIDFPRLLWVRSFAYLYNPVMAIYVFSNIKKIYHNATLTMVGPPKDKSLEECKLLAIRLNLTVNFTGKLTKQEWIKLSQYHNIFINTTHFDNTPVSIMEAMALGLPIISTSVGGIPYLLKNLESAFLVNDNSSSEMVSAVQYIIENPKKTFSIIQNARLLAEKFDWDIVKLKWISILK